MFDSVIIGAGVIGSSIARELSKFAGKFCLIEKTEDVCSGTSKANSAIVHGGFDAENGSMMAKMNVLGNKMMDKISKDLDIPFKRNGAMVLCFDEESKPKLNDLLERGIKNGVENMKVLTREEALVIEPNLSDSVCAALHVPSSGIICPFELTLGMAENACDNGTEFKFNSCVKDIKKVADGYEITTDKEVIKTKSVINCAGVYADEIHNMVCEDKIEIKPRKGEYILCDKTASGLVTSTLFQLPTALGKGILVSPTVHGNLILGPTALDIEDKEGIDTTADGLSMVLRNAALSIKNLPTRQAITSFSGLRAHMAEHDFVLKESSDNFFDAAGTESPGLTSAPAIGVYMAEMVAKKLDLSEKTDFNPIRHGVIKAAELSFEDRKELIEKEPLYGQIICRCEMVSEGEIVSSINRTLGATTLDGVKRRTRAGMGRCQAGFCSPKVMDILARELSMPVTSIRKNGDNSYIALEKTSKGVAK